jgi:signal transduction histidine kinase
MPGLVRLRALLNEPPDQARREPLVFWTAYGAESLECNVKTLAEPGNDSLMLVSLGGDDEPAAKAIAAKPAALAPPAATSAAAPVPIISPAPATAPPLAPPPAATSADDAATMQKIARAIRTGFGKAPTEDVTPPEPALPSEAPVARASADAPDLSKLAHELRTPLSAIVVAAEIMKDQRFGTIENDRYRGYSSDIHDNARHALAVINRLLGEAAVSASQRFEAVPVDLNAMAESSVSAVRPLAEEAKIKLVHELHSSAPIVLADAMTVKQILFNLLTNAIKFTRPGGEVRVVTGLGFNRSLFIAVQDTGSGMTAEEIARVLDAESPPKPERKEAGGLGIGLPLAVKLARANGARLEIDSTPGEGTAVALIFPKERIAPR